MIQYTAYGTPQRKNTEICACDLDHIPVYTYKWKNYTLNETKCHEKGDLFAACDTLKIATNESMKECVCSEDFVLNSGVCMYPITVDYCYVNLSDERNCAMNDITLSWETLIKSKVNGYQIYKDDTLFLTVSSVITALKIETNLSLDDSYENSAKIQYGNDCGNNCILVQTKSQWCVRTNWTIIALNYNPYASDFKYWKIATQCIFNSTIRKCGNDCPTESPTAYPTIFSEAPTSFPTYDIVNSTEIAFMTTEEDGTECSGLDSAIAYLYEFEYNHTQETCNLCLHQKGKRAERECEKMGNIIDGVVDEFSVCLLSVCDYGCTVGELIHVSRSDTIELCGCDSFEYPLVDATDSKLLNNWMLIVIINIMFVFVCGVNL